ncbi:uncharacterized protein LOC116299019 isoform X2 [Actinia tenebrosa]|uniref:Uncharacterized protein LOC116299019 isoform X2 n=1 Tax=Actinia tenebrosa TaxID=6105 RepID=A0A6P8ICM3_ACTTE|nr:uncharacterized protein LOC116299019 isoform X2 [Actinia tenebrosa]
MDYHHVLLMHVLLVLGFLAVVLARPKLCSHEGRLYKHNDQITLNNCTYICTCDTATQATSVFLCVPLCVWFVDRACPNGYIESHVMVRSGPPSSGCYCAVHKCIKSNILSQVGQQQYSIQHKKVKVHSGSKLKVFSIQGNNRLDG